MTNNELYIKLINDFKNRYHFNERMVDSPTTAMEQLQIFSEGIVAGMTLAHNIEHNTNTK